MRRGYDRIGRTIGGGDESVGGGIETMKQILGLSKLLGMLVQSVDGEMPGILGILP